jgi:hypothetical protein
MELNMKMLNTDNQPIKVWKYARGNNNKAIYIDYMNVTFYMSYDTCIAFSSIPTGLVVHDNIWSTTTGAHLNTIDGGDLLSKTKRVNAKQFAAKLAEMEQSQRRSTIAVYEILKDKKDAEFRNNRLAQRIKLNGGYSKAGH